MNSVLIKNTMKAKNIFLFLLFLVPSLTFAGEIFGTLKKDGKPMVNQEISITQNGKVIATDSTDAKGYFSINLKQVGQFKLEVKGYDGATFDVFSTNNSVDLTLSLVKSGDKWLLKKM